MEITPKTSSNISHMSSQKNIAKYLTKLSYSFSKQKNKWVSYCCINKKRKHIGYFTTEQQAFEAREKYIKNKI